MSNYPLLDAAREVVRRTLSPDSAAPDVPNPTMSLPSGTPLSRTTLTPRTGTRGSAARPVARLTGTDESSLSEGDAGSQSASAAGLARFSGFAGGFGGTGGTHATAADLSPVQPRAGSSDSDSLSSAARAPRMAASPGLTAAAVPAVPAPAAGGPAARRSSPLTSHSGSPPTVGRAHHQEAPRRTRDAGVETSFAFLPGGGEAGTKGTHRVRTVGTAMTPTSTSRTAPLYGAAATSGVAHVAGGGRVPAAAVAGFGSGAAVPAATSGASLEILRAQLSAALATQAAMYQQQELEQQQLRASLAQQLQAVQAAIDAGHTAPAEGGAARPAVAGSAGGVSTLEDAHREIEALRESVRQLKVQLAGRPTLAQLREVQRREEALFGALVSARRELSSASRASGPRLPKSSWTRELIHRDKVSAALGSAPSAAPPVSSSEVDAVCIGIVRELCALVGVESIGALVPEVTRAWHLALAYPLLDSFAAIVCGEIDAVGGIQQSHDVGPAVGEADFAAAAAPSAGRLSLQRATVLLSHYLEELRALRAARAEGAV